MPRVGFITTVPASARTETVHDLDRSATVTGFHYYYYYFLLLLRAHSNDIRASLVGTQLCSEHIAAAVNQLATIEEAVFCVGPSRSYITQLVDS
jgi:CDP-diglyceride synthetase